MNHEENRLNTFAAWPATAAIEPIRVAKAGFFYTGQGVEVQCFSCGGKISEWSYGDQAMARHRRLDPRCPFVVDPNNSGNVPLVLGQSSGGGGDASTSRSSTSNNSDPSQATGSVDSNPSANNEDELYRNDAMRLLSFINWPVSFISRESLASAGFYHTGGGRVRCAWCGGELCGGWRQGDRPIDEHRRHFPNCDYARIASMFNPLDAPAPVSQPETPPVGSPPIEETPSQTEAVEHNWRVLESTPWRPLGVVGCGAEGAKHPARASVGARKVTFNNWPSNLRQTPELLAEAGFYYTGSYDQVICFYCGGGLGKWEPSDTPWNEHARWFPDCGYVLLIKGRDFIEQCKRGETNQAGPANNNNNLRRSTSGSRVQFPVTEAQVVREMEGPDALSALFMGLEVARVKAAIRKKLRNTGTGFSTFEALVDATLNEQLNEESWGSETTSDPINARAILAETLRTLRTAASDTLGNWSSEAPAPPPAASPRAEKSPERAPEPPKPVSLEEENRQLREARQCKVCMDCEVSVVFLPCGHLVSCGTCGVSLAACPLCRAPVQAFVRAYLA